MTSCATWHGAEMLEEQWINEGHCSGAVKLEGHGRLQVSLGEGSYC
jgi:hypothetical protein